MSTVRPSHVFVDPADQRRPSGRLPIGSRYGRVIVTGLAHNLRTRRMEYLVRCECGQVRIKAKNQLGVHSSCGCAKGRNISRARVEHGMTDTPTWRSWQAMLTRCTNQHHSAYYRYGGMGITVCERWKLFENFLADMGERPEGKTLDRFPNKNGGYERGNCRWATVREQVLNRRNLRSAQR